MFLLRMGQSMTWPVAVSLLLLVLVCYGEDVSTATDDNSYTDDFEKDQNLNISWTSVWQKYIKIFPRLKSRQYDQSASDYENITAVLGERELSRAQNYLDAKQDNIYSFARPPNFEFDGEVAENANGVYIVQDIQLCNDMIVVQQRTHLLYEISTVLPFRSLAIIDCLNNDPPSVNLNWAWKNFYSQNGKHRARIVHGDQLNPGSSFKIGNMTVRVEEENESINVVAAIDFFINIRDKSANLKVGQFSFRNPAYKNVFTEYALTVPFSQSVLLQAAPLAVKISAQNYPDDDDMLVATSYTDVIYCGNRKCDGGPFEGIDDTPYAFNREDYFPTVFSGINTLLTKDNRKTSLIMRSILNQKSQFANHVQYTGLFMTTAQCYVSQTADDFGDGVQNELPHEMGHTYNLRDYHGLAGPKDKLTSYALNRDNSLLEPWKDSDDINVIYRGSMNSGTGNPSFKYYTRLNHYSTLAAHRSVNLAKDDLPDEFWKNIKNPEMRSIVVTKQSKEFIAFVINAYAKHTVLLTSPPTPGDSSTVVLKRYTCDNLLEVKYLKNVDRFVLPYEWVKNREASFVVEYNGSTKRFYLTDEARHKLPAPYYAISHNIFSRV